MNRMLVAVVIALASSGAWACSCSHGILGNEEASEASEIFVFRVVSAVADAEGPDLFDGEVVTAQIRVVDVLRGAPRTKRMRYSTSFCCGTRIDVGQYYAAFLSDSGDEFFGHFGNLLNLGGYYEPEAREGGLLRLVASGEQTFDAAFGRSANEKLHMIPPPPPPPPPCPRD